MIETVGQLRAAIALLPDDTPIEVYSECKDSLVDFDISIEEGCVLQINAAD